MSETQNARPSESPLKPQNAPSSVRRPLGDVSPNIRHGLPANVLGSKPMSGSPLKRSFTAAMSDSQGFQYLKKRKLSGETPLSEVATPTVQSTSLLASSWDRAPAESGLESSAIPEIQEQTPTEPNTPTASQQGDYGQESSTERKSFSSLINYDPSSQPAAAWSQQPQYRQRRSSSDTNLGESLAAILRTRLQLAMFKVRTNQTHIPFKDLQVSEEIVATAQAFSHRQHTAKGPFPNLIPGPVLRPTAYSSRMVYGPSSPSEAHTAPRSPPPTRSSDTSVLPNSHEATLAKSWLAGGLDEPELTNSTATIRVMEKPLELQSNEG